MKFNGTAKGFMLGAILARWPAWLQVSKDVRHAHAKPSASQRTALRPTPPPGKSYGNGDVVRLHVQVRDYQTIERSTVLPC
jgi:hypothetical protein